MFSYKPFAFRKFKPDLFTIMKFAEFLKEAGGRQKDGLKGPGQRIFC
jgi:hypothetical protein